PVGSPSPDSSSAVSLAASSSAGFSRQASGAASTIANTNGGSRWLAKVTTTKSRRTPGESYRACSVQGPLPRGGTKHGRGPVVPVSESESESKSESGGTSSLRPVLASELVSLPVVDPLVLVVLVVLVVLIGVGPGLPGAQPVVKPPSASAMKRRRRAMIAS